MSSQRCGECGVYIAAASGHPHLQLARWDLHIQTNGNDLRQHYRCDHLLLDQWKHTDNKFERVPRTNQHRRSNYDAAGDRNGQWNTQDVEGLYIPLASAPTFSVDSGTYATPQTVSITDSTPGAIIQYQTGTFPTASSPIYSGPITVSSSEYIYATATASGYLPSEMSNAFYEINPLAEQTAAPSFSVPAGTYTTPQTVAIADTTAGAYVYYTTDGSTPTARSTVYGTPITVSSTQTLKAIVRAGGDTVSAVTSAVYTISPPTPSFSITGTAIRMARGATSGNTSTIILTPTGGFTGAIRLSCAISPRAANDPATCSIPTSATISGAAAQTTLTVNTTAVASISNPSESLVRTICKRHALVHSACRHSSPSAEVAEHSRYRRTAFLHWAIELWWGR